MCDNFDDEKREHLKIEGNKRKKAKQDSLNVDEKKQLRKCEKKEKAMRDNLDDEQKEHLKIKENKRKKEKRDNPNLDEKEQLRKYENKGKMDKHLQTLDERNSIFKNVKMCTMVDPSILTTPAFRLLKKISKLLFRKSLLTFVIFVGNLNFEGVLLNY